jgi:hypothetical protein
MSNYKASNQIELEWFMNKFDDLIKEYNGKWLAIDGEKVVGVGNSMIEASKDAEKNNCLSPFLVPAKREGWGRYYGGINEDFYNRA